MTDRRQDTRRDDDYVLAYRVDSLERLMDTFAPIATQVALHAHQLEEGEKRMAGLEETLDRCLAKVDSLVLKVEGMAVKLALIVGFSALAGGAIVSVAVGFLTH